MIESILLALAVSRWLTYRREGRQGGSALALTLAALAGFAFDIYRHPGYLLPVSLFAALLVAQSVWAHGRRLPVRAHLGLGLAAFLMVLVVDSGSPAQAAQDFARGFRSGWEAAAQDGYKVGGRR